VRKRTILRVTVIDIAIAERTTRGQVPADANRNNLANLVEQIVELRVIDILVKIADVQRGGYELVRVRRRRDAIWRSRHWTLMLLRLNLRHLKNRQNRYTKKTDRKLNPNRFGQFFLE